MATKYVRAAGGAWGDAATWALTSGGTETTTVPTAADDVVTDSNSGASTVGANISVKSFVQTGTPGAVTNNGFTISSAGNVTLLSGKYIAASNAAQISITAAGSLTTGGNAMGGVTLSAAAVCGDNLTFIADKLCTLILNGNFLDVNGKTISGNSATNRLLIYSSVAGTPRTVTVNGGTFANCDFQDIAFNNGGADLDLSAITGFSGDCGGNSMSGGGTLTFTAPTTQTFAATGGNWSDVAKWTSRVPLPQDLARFQPMSASQTITVDMPRLPDTDFSGVTNSPTVTATTAGLTYSIYGSLNLTGIAAGGWSCTKYFYFLGRVNQSLTSNGQALVSTSTGGIIINITTSTITFNDAVLSALFLQISSGTVNTNYNVTAGQIIFLAGSIVNMGNGTWLATSLGNTTVFRGLGLINCGTSTIALTNTGTKANSFEGGTNTYNDIQIAPGSGVLTFSGAFTFRNMVMSSAGTRSIVFTKATTYTQTGDTFLSGSGVDDAPIITPSLLNGGFETAGAGGADVFANWLETVTGASTITRDTADKYAGDASCRFNVDASNSIIGISQAGLVVGRLYKLSFYAKINDASGTAHMKAAGSAVIYIAPKLTTSYVRYECYFIADAATLYLQRNDSASKTIWIDDVTLTPLNSVLIQSSGAGEAFTLSKASGLIASNFLALKDSIATGGAVWLAGYNSTNISGNTGWHFNSPASGAGSIAVTGVGVGKALCRAIGAGIVNFTGSAISTAKALCKAISAGTVSFASTVTASLQASAIGAGIIEFTGSSITTAKALASGIGIGNIEFAGTGGAKAICKAIGAGTVRFLATVFPTAAVWDISSLLKATERYVGQYFKASKRRK